MQNDDDDRMTDGCRNSSSTRPFPAPTARLVEATDEALSSLPIERHQKYFLKPTPNYSNYQLAWDWIE
jgi:hypothetical protein